MMKKRIISLFLCFVIFVLPLSNTVYGTSDLSLGILDAETKNIGETSADIQFTDSSDIYVAGSVLPYGLYEVRKATDTPLTSAQEVVEAVYGKPIDAASADVLMGKAERGGEGVVTGFMLGNDVATETITGLEADTDYVVYAALGDWNDWINLQLGAGYTETAFVTVAFTTQASGEDGDGSDGGDEVTDPVASLSYSNVAPKKYATIGEAVAAANALDSSIDDVVLTLQDDISIDATTTLSGTIMFTRNITMDFNGYTVSVTPKANYPVGIEVYADGFTMMDSSANKAGKLVMEHSDTYQDTFGIAINMPQGTEDSEVNEIVGYVSIGDLEVRASTQAIIVVDHLEATITNCELYGSATFNGELVNSSIRSNATMATIGGALNTDSMVIKNSTITYDGETEKSGIHIINIDSSNYSDYEHDPTLSEYDCLIVENSVVEAPVGIYIESSLSGKDVKITLDDNSKIIGTYGAGIEFESASLGNIVATVRDGSALSGATYAVNSKIWDDVYNRISIEDTAFIGYGILPTNLGTRMLNYPENKVLNVSKSQTVGYEEFYEIISTSALAGTNALGVPITYQNFGGETGADGLNAMLSQAKVIYMGGSSQYGTDAWETFATAYNEANALVNEDGTSANLNANQNEIDYRSNALGRAMIALEDGSELVYLSELADGTYTIETYMMNINGSGALSMANDAIDNTATIEIDDGIAYLHINFVPLYLGEITGHLENFWYYDNSNPPTASNCTDADRVEAEYSNWYNHVGNSPPEYVNDGAYPGTVTIKMPYFGNVNGAEQIYGRVYVDAMEEYGLQNVIISLKYSTLTPVDVEPTLSLATDEVSLKAGATQAVTAELLGADGYTIGAPTSDKAAVATATYANDKVTVTAVSEGIATITVTATKDGADTLTKTITVTVHAADAENVDVTPSVAGTSANADITGTALVTSGGSDKVSVTADDIAIDATSTGSGITTSTATFAADTLDALKATGKTVTIKTDVATFELDAAMLTAMSAGTESVVLKIDKTDASQTGAGGTYSSAYAITLKSGGTDIAFGGGKVKVSVPGTNEVWAYHIESAKIKERVPVSVIEGMAGFTISHFSTWALSANEYEVDSGGTTPPTDDDYFLDDGNYYVQLQLWHESTSVESMGDVAFENNRYALVTVDGGEITKVQIATNPVAIGDAGGEPVESAVIDIRLGTRKEAGEDPADLPSVTNIVFGDFTTSLSGDDIRYIRTAEFDMPDVGQPEISNQATYVPVAIMVPDTPMDEVSTAGYMFARLRFSWSTADETSDEILVQDDGEAEGTSPGGGSGGGVEEDTAETETVKAGESVTSSALDDIIEAEKELVVEGEDGIQAQFDVDALSAIAEEAGASTVTITLDEVAKDDLTEAQQAALGDSDRPVYDLKIMAGTVEISDFGNGEVQITIPYTLKEGENHDALVIWYIDEDGKVTAIDCEYEDGFITFITDHFSVYMVAYDESLLWTNIFTDVTENDWFFEAVKYAYVNGLFSGTSDTTFAPNSPMTRAMLWTVLARMEGVDTTGGEMWYSKGMDWAMTNEVSDGTNPDGNITRQELATMLYRYAEATAVTVDFTLYKDSADIATWATEAMQWAVSEGLITGMDDGSLAPTGEATRAQVVTILMRYMQK